MRNKRKTVWELIILAIASFPVFHYLSIFFHSVDISFLQQYFNIISIVAPICFLAIAIFSAISPTAAVKPFRVLK
jgi:hypothetical protein